MSLMDLIKADAQKFTSNTGEFGVSITFTGVDSPPSVATIAGTTTKHHLGADREGAPVNLKTESCTVAEKLLTDVDYPVRDANRKVNMKGHKVRWIDGNGTELNYIIDQSFPDEKLGLIVFVLGDCKQ